MRDRLGAQYAVITWKELNQSLYSALEMEKTVLFFTLALIIVVASLNIVAGLILMVIQKIKDIGILLSCGATAGLIRKIFFFQGAIIGVLGTSLGVASGPGLLLPGQPLRIDQGSGGDLPGQLRSLPRQPPGPGRGDRRCPADQLQRHAPAVTQGGRGRRGGRREVRMSSGRKVSQKKELFAK